MSRIPEEQNIPEYRFRGKYPHNEDGVVVYSSQFDYSPERVIELICLGNEEIDFTTFPPQELLALAAYIEENYLNNPERRELFSYQTDLITGEPLRYGRILDSVVIAIRNSLPPEFQSYMPRP